MGSKIDEPVKNALLSSNEYEIFATIFPEEVFFMTIQIYLKNLD